MIGNYNVGLFFIKFFSSFYLYNHRCEKSVDFGPNTAADVTGDFATGNVRQNNGKQPKEKGINNQKWNEKQPFIRLVKQVTNFFHGAKNNIYPKNYASATSNFNGNE